MQEGQNKQLLYLFYFNVLPALPATFSAVYLKCSLTRVLELLLLLLLLLLVN